MSQVPKTTMLDLHMMVAEPEQWVQPCAEAGGNMYTFHIGELLILTTFTLIRKKLTIPHICHGRHGRRPCKFFLAGVNFYRFNAKNWQKLAFLVQILV